MEVKQSIANQINSHQLLKMVGLLDAGVMVWDPELQQFQCDDYLCARLGIPDEIALDALLPYIGGQSEGELKGLLQAALEGGACSASLLLGGAPASLWLQQAENAQVMLLFSFHPVIHTMPGAAYGLSSQSVLNGVASESLLKELLIQSVRLAQRHNEALSVMRIRPLFHFKESSERLPLLQMVAKRLQNGLRSSDNIACLNEDEFVVILHGTSRQQAQVVANKVQAWLTPAYRMGYESYTPKLLLEIAVFPENGSSPDELLAASQIDS